jgi:hypothetical protein
MNVIMLSVMEPTQYNETQHNETQHNDIQHNDTQHISIIMNNTWHSTMEDHYNAKCCYAEYNFLFIIMLSVVMLSVIVLSVIMLSVIMLSVISWVSLYTLIKKVPKNAYASSLF